LDGASLNKRFARTDSHEGLLGVTTLKKGRSRLCFQNEEERTVGVKFEDRNLRVGKAIFTQSQGGQQSGQLGQKRGGHHEDSLSYLRPG